MRSLRGRKGVSDPSPHSERRLQIDAEYGYKTADSKDLQLNLMAFERVLISARRRESRRDANPVAERPDYFGPSEQMEPGEWRFLQQL